MKILNKHFLSKIPANAVYIGRGSKWGNPFVIGVHGTRTEVIDKYREYIKNKPELLSCLPELVGKDVVCYCTPLPCHGEVLLELVEALPKKIDFGER